MAAADAHQHASLWNRRPGNYFQVPGIHFTGMMPSYNTPALQNHQPPTTQMDMNLPLVSATTMPMASYQSSALFAYESSVNSYNMQESSMPQTYPIAYSSTNFPVASLATQPPVQEVDYQSALYGNYMAKLDIASPVQPAYSDASYATNCRQSFSQLDEATNPHFATDVDTLMKAIQAKKTTLLQKQEVVKVGSSLLLLSFCTDL
jgi:hypothetical protein